MLTVSQLNNTSHTVNTVVRVKINYPINVFIYSNKRDQMWVNTLK